MRPVEVAERNLMRHHAAESFTWKPAVKMKGRLLHLEGWFAQLGEIKIDGMIWRRTNRGRNVTEHRQHGAMNVAGGDEPDPRIAGDNCSEFVCIMQILAIHVPNPRNERRVMQEQQCRPV
jgi:hypothetical protein